MSVHIACSVPKCTNPVIGQCTGYKKTCGRYYCHEHSSDTLCAECASQKAADEHAQLVYQEYLALLEKVSREPVPIPKFQFQSKNLVKIGGCSFTIGTILLFLLILIGVIVGNISQTVSGGIVAFYALSIIVSLVILGWPFGIIPLVWVIQSQNFIDNERQKRISERINVIEKEKPGFTQFLMDRVKQPNEGQAEKKRKASVRTANDQCPNCNSFRTYNKKTRDWKFVGGFAVVVAIATMTIIGGLLVIPLLYFLVRAIITPSEIWHCSECNHEWNDTIS